MRINKERPARKDGHSHVKSDLSSYIGSSYKRNGQRAKSLREIPPLRYHRLRVFPFMIIGVVEKLHQSRAFTVIPAKAGMTIKTKPPRRDRTPCLSDTCAGPPDFVGAVRERPLRRNPDRPARGAFSTTPGRSRHAQSFLPQPPPPGVSRRILSPRFAERRALPENSCVSSAWMSEFLPFMPGSPPFSGQGAFSRLSVMNETVASPRISISRMMPSPPRCFPRTAAAAPDGVAAHPERIGVLERFYRGVQGVGEMGVDGVFACAPGAPAHAAARGLIIGVWTALPGPRAVVHAPHREVVHRAAGGGGYLAGTGLGERAEYHVHHSLARLHVSARHGGGKLGVHHPCQTAQ